MKAFIAGVITLTILICAVTLNAVFISKKTDKLISIIDTLSNDLQSADSSDLENEWDKSKGWFALTVHRESIESIDDTIALLKTETEAGNETGYLVARTQLGCLMERLRKTESFSLERIF